MQKEYGDLKLTIGNIIKTHRQKMNLTLEELAEKADLDANNISRLERGETLPSITTYIKLTLALKIDQNNYLELFEKVLKQEE